MPFEAQTPSVPPPSVASVDSAPPVSAGSMIGRTFSTWARRLWLFAAMTVVVFVPVVAVAAALGLATVFGGILRGQPPTGENVWLFVAVVVPLALVAMLVQMCGLTYAAIQHLGGRPVHLGTMLAVGFRNIGRVLLLGLLLLGAYLVVALVLGLVTGIVGVVVGGGVAAFILALVAVPLGLYLFAALALTIPAMVAERAGPIRGLARSWSLTEGHRGGILGAFLVVFLTNLAINWTVGFVSGRAFGALGAAGVVAVVIGFVVQILTMPLGTVFPAVAYHDIRIEEEGTSTSELGQVFE